MNNRFVKARVLMGLSQIELAEQAGVSRSSIVRMERNEEVTISTYNKVAKVLQLPQMLF